MRSAFGPAVREIWRYLYRLGPFGSPKQKHPSHAQEAKPGSLSPADTKSHLARPPAIRPLPLIARSQPVSRHGIPRALRSPLQRLSGLLPATCLLLATVSYAPDLCWSALGVLCVEHAGGRPPDRHAGVGVLGAREAQDELHHSPGDDEPNGRLEQGWTWRGAANEKEERCGGRAQGATPSCSLDAGWVLGFDKGKLE